MEWGQAFYISGTIVFSLISILLIAVTLLVGSILWKVHSTVRRMEERVKNVDTAIGSLQLYLIKRVLKLLS